MFQKSNVYCMYLDLGCTNNGTLIVYVIQIVIKNQLLSLSKNDKYAITKHIYVSILLFVSFEIL